MPRSRAVLACERVRVRSAGWAQWRGGVATRAVLFACLCLVWGLWGARRCRSAGPRTRAWLLLYVMPYDNDLERCARPIASALRAGLRGEEVAVGLLADTRSRQGLRRTLLTSAGTQGEYTGSEDSADARGVGAYLDWALARAPARRVALVFLDHGGALEQMGLDENTSTSDAGAPSSRSLSTRAVGEELRGFRRRHPTVRVPLLFLQQCGRASLEASLYLRGAAEMQLASQQNVGACNSYYGALLSLLAAEPEAPPERLAERIMDTDRDYDSYSLLRDEALAEWPERSRAFVDAALASLPPGEDLLAGLEPTFSYGLERNYDLLQLLAAVRGRAPSTEAAARELERWVRERLVVRHRWRPESPAARWCGVSALVPAATGYLALYRGQPAYEGTRWGELTERLGAAHPLSFRVP